MLKIQHADPERPRQLNPRVPADLEAIVLKCLEKDRARRYATAADLAADLARWLRGEPVQAQPPTLGYLLQKSIRRHRVARGPGLLAGAGRTAGDRPLIRDDDGDAQHAVRARRRRPDERELGEGERRLLRLNAKVADTDRGRGQGAARDGEASRRRSCASGWSRMSMSPTVSAGLRTATRSKRSPGSPTPCGWKRVTENERRSTATGWPRRCVLPQALQVFFHEGAVNTRVIQPGRPHGSSRPVATRRRGSGTRNRDSPSRRR